MVGLGFSGTLIIRGFGFTTLQTTLMQVRLLGLLLLLCPYERLVCKIPYGSFIAIVYASANSLPVCSIKHFTRRIFISIYVSLKLPKNTRTILMCVVTLPTILGFALVAWLPTHMKVGRLIGYCAYLLRVFTF